MLEHYNTQAAMRYPNNNLEQHQSSGLKSGIGGRVGLLDFSSRALKIGCKPNSRLFCFSSLISANNRFSGCPKYPFRYSGPTGSTH